MIWFVHWLWLRRRFLPYIIELYDSRNATYGHNHFWNNHSFLLLQLLFTFELRSKLNLKPLREKTYTLFFWWNAQNSKQGLYSAKCNRNWKIECNNYTPMTVCYVQLLWDDWCCHFYDHIGWNSVEWSKDIRKSYLMLVLIQHTWMYVFILTCVKSHNFYVWCITPAAEQIWCG